MKSNSEQRPKVIERVSPCAVRYNYNIQPYTKEIGEGEEKIIEEGFTCNYVEVEEPSYNNLVRAILRSEIDETAEMALINSYNAYQNKIITDKTVVDEYKQWMQHVVEVKAMVRADLATIEEE